MFTNLKELYISVKRILVNLKSNYKIINNNKKTGVTKWVKPPQTRKYHSHNKT